MKTNFYLYWMRENGWPKHCQACNVRLTHKQRSIDHIIPKSICFELEMPELLWDKRNLTLLCVKCNSKKSNSTTDLPEKVKLALEKRRQSLLTR